MLLTPLIKRQLRVFAVLATVALGYAFIHYARVPAMLGAGVYNVTVDFEDASGLYPRAAVTYRGVNVGVVSELGLTGDGAVATLRIDSGTDIPAGVSAELHSTSAIGEQYIDLVDPTGSDTSGKGSYLAEGAAIPQERAVEMPQITPVLDSVNRLLKSIPKEKTKAVLSQLDEGLGGSGSELNELVDSSGKLLTEAQSQIDVTTSLIAVLRPVLGTQAELASETQSYADALNDVTSALARNDSADLKTLLNNAPGGLDAATATVADLQQVLPMMLANLTTNAEVLNTYLPNVKQILVLYPSLVARLQAAVNPRAGLGDVQLDLRAGVNNPPTCQTGYLPANERRSPGITTTRDVNRLAHCEIAPDNPTAVRGGRNLPCPHSSTRGPLPAACGITFRGGIWPDSSGTVAYDIAVGRGDDAAASDVTPDQQADDEDLWKVLVLVPLERS
ncbi:MAG TPA: MCE family protein [Nocardioidaceae bacterium]|nr:MCE family protein [Nocardioidaceae bacterium]